MQIQEYLKAYGIFAQVHAEKTGKSEAEVRAEITLEEFERKVRELHERWIGGEFSLGRFTELMGVPHWELWEILDALGLPRHR